MNAHPRFRSRPFAGFLVLAVPCLCLWAADDPLAALRDYTAGQGPERLGAVETLVRQALGKPEAAAVETGLISVLESTAAFDAKDFACRQLRIIGTEKAVPALAKLLPDPQLSSIARYALQGIPARAAGDALRAALGETRGTNLAGVINSLGLRAEPESIPALVPMLSSAEVEVVAATLTALGRIGGESALDPLRAFAANYDPSAADGGVTTQLRLAPEVKAKLDVTVLANAFLALAEDFLRAGNENYATQIYSRLVQAQGLSSASRLAALRGWVATDAAQALPVLVDLLKSEDAGVRTPALGLVPLLPGAEAGQLAAQLEQFPTATLPFLVGALAGRNEPALLPSLVRLSEHNSREVRLAALRALGFGDGNAASVNRLLAVAAGGRGEESELARESLRHVRGRQADDVLAATIASGTGMLRIEAIRAAAPRALRAALTDILTAANAPDAAVRTAALAALAELGGPPEQPVLLDRLLKADSTAERDEAARALAAVTRRMPATDARVQPLVGALPSAPLPAKAALLDGLAQIGGPEALRAVTAAAKQGEAEARGAAINALAGWPDASAADALLAIARTTDNEAHRTVALRGFLQFVDQPGRTPAQLLGQYQLALDVARRADEKRLVLGGLGNVPDLGALTLAETLLNDPALKNEAGLAVARIARAMAGAAPAEARAAALKVVAAQPSEAVVAQAREVLNYLERFEDFVNAWMLAGPFMKEGATDQQLFGIAFPPEQADASVQWRPVQATGGIVPLDQLIGGDNRVAYLKATIISPQARRARLEMGSDDGLKVWLNGTVVHANNINRGYTAGEDKVDIALKEGANPLLVKVTQGGGGWTVGVRLRAADGSRLEGVQVKAE